jgi:uncharacterized ion transporter superfamily protein YfcC
MTAARPRFRAPDTFVLMGSFLLLVALATWILPGGEFQREEKGGRAVVQAGSYERVESQPQGPGAVLLAPIRGFQGKADVIGFVLLVGGAFGVLQRTRAIDGAIRSVVVGAERSPWVRRATIPVFMTLFSLGGAVFGMSEEVIPFVLIFIPLALALGYDSITGVAIPFVGAGAGFAGAFLNPFTLQIAQGIAELQPVSGWEYRLVVWGVVTATAITFVMLYARRIRQHPEKSPTFALDRERTEKAAVDDLPPLDRRRALVLLSFAAGMGVLVWGVVARGWYIEEIAALFVAVAIVAGVVGGLKAREISRSMVEGARELVATALVIALAQGILVLAEAGRIIDTVLHGLSGLIGGFHPIVTSQLMVLVQSAINIVVPSGSGQAALTMPIMAPLADLVGVSRQTAVLAFQFGDGFSNLIIPTSAVTMGVLTLARIDWLKWSRWILPLQLLFFLLACLLMVPAYFLWN